MSVRINKNYLLIMKSYFLKKYLITIRDVDRWISYFCLDIKEENAAGSLWVSRGELLGLGVCG